ncbi:uncharacterized protein LOC126967237 [Leptidea sinapis]|uniref:uncharacterized protein LOC126967237 n=1 Tax=Leptidea sinapis TaxID=189913 RepID=UPI002137667E|nr:uncharacterized protein LOC126967237 [Leptidea sinapis]
MAYWIAYLVLVTLTCAQPSEEEDVCPGFCSGEAYDCIDGDCYCAPGFIPNYYQTRCIECPGLGEACYGPCCGGNTTLQCWHGVCQTCYSTFGTWICRDQFIMVSGTQIVMASALVLGIIATFILLYKLCAVPPLRPMSRERSANSEGRLSVGSLQIYVNERLRDAPPRYTSTAPSGSTTYPASVYLNSGFMHDNSIPPPSYTPELKNDTNQDRTQHI